MQAGILFKVEKHNKKQIVFSIERSIPKSPLFESSLFTQAQQNTIFKPFSSITEIDTKCNDESINNPLSTTSTYSSDPHSNYNIYHITYNKKVNLKKEINKNRTPSSNYFNSKVIKRENIDKQIFRKFRAFIIDTHHKNPQLFQYSNSIFWNDFCKQKLIPPMRYKECIGNNKFVEFKSFNAQYYYWLFSKKGASRLFDLFVIEKGDLVINSIIANNKADKDKHNDLQQTIANYLPQIPCMFAQSKIPFIVNKCNEPLCSCNGCNLSLDDLLLNNESDEGEPQKNLLDMNHPLFINNLYQSSVHDVEDRQGMSYDSCCNNVNAIRFNGDYYNDYDNDCEGECENECVQRDMYQGNSFDDCHLVSCEDNCKQKCESDCSYSCQKKKCIEESNKNSCEEICEGSCNDNQTNFQFVNRNTKRNGTSLKKKRRR